MHTVIEFKLPRLYVQHVLNPISFAHFHIFGLQLKWNLHKRSGWSVYLSLFSEMSTDTDILNEQSTELNIRFHLGERREGEKKINREPSKRDTIEGYGRQQRVTT